MCRDSPDIRIVENWDRPDTRVSDNHEMLFERVAVSPENAIGLHPHDQSPASDQVVLHDFVQVNMVLLGVLYDSITGNIRGQLVGWSREYVSVSLGVSLTNLPRIQGAFDEIDSLLSQNRLLLNAAYCGQSPVSNSGLLKVVVIGNILAVTEKALEPSGNHGLSRHNPPQ